MKSPLVNCERTAGPVKHSRRVAKGIEALRVATAAIPLITDDIARWLPPRAVHALHARGITTVAELTLRIPRRKQWWSVIPKLGQASARQIEAFFAAHPARTDRARALMKSTGSPIVVAWETMRLPHEIDGSCGVVWAPRESCARDAHNDYDAMQTCVAARVAVQAAWPVGKKPSASFCGRSSNGAERSLP